MPVSATIRERCRAMLGPGEDIRYVFPAVAVPPPATIGFLVVVTDRSITLLSTKMFSRDEPSGCGRVTPAAPVSGRSSSGRAPASKSAA